MVVVKPLLCRFGAMCASAVLLPHPGLLAEESGDSGKELWQHFILVACGVDGAFDEDGPDQAVARKCTITMDDMVGPSKASSGGARVIGAQPQAIVMAVVAVIGPQRGAVGEDPPLPLQRREVAVAFEEGKPLEAVVSGDTRPTPSETPPEASIFENPAGCSRGDDINLLVVVVVDDVDGFADAVPVVVEAIR